MAIEYRLPAQRWRWGRRWMWISGAAVLLLALLAVAAWFIFIPVYQLDLLIENGLVVDGTGEPPRRYDVAIRDGRVVAIGRSWRFLFSRPKLRLEASGKIVAPGFIDVHTHIEPNLPASSVFRPANFLRQGVTTIITGNCGRSRVNLAETFRQLEKHGTAINVASLVGHNSLRREVMGEEARAPTPEELERMKQLVDKAMTSGALGLSTGLVYNPGRFAETPEVVALASAAAKYDGLYVSHIRDEGREGMAALREALEIGRQAKARTHISHFKSSGPSQWGAIEQRLALLDAARQAGQQVAIDVYPYTRSSTTTDVLLPDWAVKNKRQGLRQAAQDAKSRQKLRADILQSLRQDGWRDLAHIRLVSGKPEWVGRTLVEIPKVAADLDQQIENLIEISLRGGAQAVYADMSEADVEEVMTYRFCVFGSDSAVRDPDGQYKPHPRGAGTFPRIFRLYVKEKNLLTLSAAVHKATGQAAELFNLEGRGHLRPGEWADVVIFDPQRIEDLADYDQPFAGPVGIDYVIVNGVVAVDHDALTAASSGKALRKSSAMARSNGE
ncbi:MAG: N-acyl-D-amino-acid deacylase family protein [Blastocatellia bacterium]